MKRFLWWSLPITAIVVALIGERVWAEPPFAPVATCDKGVCTMKEEDFNQWRNFHFALITTMQDMQNDRQLMQARIESLERKINAAVWCEAKRT